MANRAEGCLNFQSLDAGGKTSCYALLHISRWWVLWVASRITPGVDGHFHLERGTGRMTRALRLCAKFIIGRRPVY